MTYTVFFVITGYYLVNNKFKIEKNKKILGGDIDCWNNNDSDNEFNA